MISSSKNVLKSKDTASVQPFIPPIQTPNVRPAVFPKVKRDPEPELFVPETEPEPESEVFQLEPNEDAELLDAATQKAEEIRMEAETIRQAAMEQAILDKQAAAEQGYQEGFEWGKQEGYKKALEEHEARLALEWETFRKNMERALLSVEEAKKRCLETYMDELKDCAVAVGEKVIHISLQSSGAIIKRMIVSEAQKLKKTAWVRIYMGKTDYEMMMQADEDIIGELSRLSEHIKFVVMNKEKRGDCIIETPDEVIDISVDTQMENIRKVLENVR